MNSNNIEHIINGIDINKIDKHPNILIAASFWEKERYDAAKRCYRFMREIDDLVDNRKSSSQKVSCLEQELLADKVNQWISCLDEEASSNPDIKELVQTIKTYKIPLLYFHNFAVAMQYDITHTGFPTFESFIQYAEGASVAPAAIFVHLCCLQKEGDGFTLPAIDILEVARPCAIFSYLVHIIRDFQKDQRENLNYFATDILEANNLCSDDLKEIAIKGAIPSSFRNVISFYMDRAERYKQKTIEQLARLNGLVNGRYRRSLELIFKLYLSVYDRIEVNHGQFTTEELNPSNEELVELVMESLALPVPDTQSGD